MNTEMTNEHYTIQEKLHILADAAKNDVACTSSGSSRRGQKGELGNAVSCGICHSFAADGRCISLLKILMTNHCVYDCKYCINRASNDVKRATFTPEEICNLTVEFYKRTKKLLSGEVPRLIDEWQLAPQLWDAARFEVDHRDELGQFIFTGSAVPVDTSKIHHSGTGRFAWLTMRTMSLSESGDSTNEVSLEVKITRFLYEKPPIKRKSRFFSLQTPHLSEHHAFSPCKPPI